MPLPELALAILALLLTPGPTNTLVLLSAGERGFRATLRLIPAELLGYLSSVLPLLAFAHAASAQMDALRPAIALAAGLWVLALALRLWQRPDARAEAPMVTARQLYVTTFLNPKGLIFGLVLLPTAPAAASVPLFAGLVVAVALVWAGLGCRLPLGAQSRLAPVLRRAAACWLALLSLGIVAGGFSA